jgi:hypothetical protein
METSPIPTTGAPDGTRAFVFGSVLPPSAAHPNNFPVDGALFPANRMDQPRAGTVEDWVVTNASSLHHPFHAHVQDAVLLRSDAPLDPATTTDPGEYPTVQSVADLSLAGPADHEQDVFNLAPALTGPGGDPLVGADGALVQPGQLVLRVRFNDYLGIYVEHCHRLPHEDRGMMSLVRTIPHDPVFAVATADPAGSRVTLVRGSDLGEAGSVVPFPGYAGRLLTAIGDVDGDTQPDLAVVAADGATTPWTILGGAGGWATPILGGDDLPGVDAVGSIALGDMNADARDDLVVGAGGGGEPRVIGLDALDGDVLFDLLAEDAAFTGGVSVAVGMIREGGRNTLVTGSGPGMPARVRTWDVDLFGDANGTMPDLHGTLAPTLTGEFPMSTETGGIEVSTGFPYALTGGLAAIAVSPLNGDAQVTLIREAAAHGVGAYSASGVARPPDPDPLRPLALEQVDRLDLVAAGYGAGADTAFVSTPTGARLVVAPATGGPVTVWDLATSPEAAAAGADPAAGAPFVQGAVLPLEGASVSGM